MFRSPDQASLVRTVAERHLAAVVRSQECLRFPATLIGTLGARISLRGDDGRKQNRRQR
jgi:hypothetical protein